MSAAKRDAILSLTILMREDTVGRSRIRKIKSSNIQAQEQSLYDVFYMSPDEARRALEQKYEFLAERYEQRFPKHKGIS
jgi:hypothetical protein